MNAKFASVILIALASCSPTPPDEPAQAPTIFAEGDIETAADGRCFGVVRGEDTFETKVEQIMVVPEERAADGSLINPAVFRNETRTFRAASTDISRFETICPPVYTRNFVLSLQRALRARGAFDGTINGQLDSATSSAIQTFQADSVNSPLLTIATARALGLVVADTPNN